jgi:hypothetical protein
MASALLLHEEGGWPACPEYPDGVDHGGDQPRQEESSHEFVLCPRKRSAFSALESTARQLRHLRRSNACTHAGDDRCQGIYVEDGSERKRKTGITTSASPCHRDAVSMSRTHDNAKPPTSSSWKPSRQTTCIYRGRLFIPLPARWELSRVIDVINRSSPRMRSDELIMTTNTSTIHCFAVVQPLDARDAVSGTGRGRQP